MENWLNYAVSNGYLTVDLLAPGDDYKYDWCDQQIEVCDWALASSVRGQLFTRFYLARLREQVRITAKRLPAPLRKLIQRAVQSSGTEKRAPAPLPSGALPESESQRS